MPAEHPEHRTDADRTEDESDASSVDRLIGVYDADGTLTGELRYWIGARLGRAHCSLCDITHGLVSEKSAWRECRDTLPVPFDTYHRNDMPESVREVSGLTLRRPRGAAGRHPSGASRIMKVKFVLASGRYAAMHP